MPFLFSKRMLALYVLSLGVLLNFIVPPFQNPDEPAHFSVILIHAFGEKKAAEAEKDIIRFMDNNNWWRFVTLGRPDPLPEKLSETERIKSTSRRVITDLSVELYHFLLGKTVGLFVKKDIKAFYYLCRLFSLLFYLGTIFLVFSTFRNISITTDKPLLFGAFFLLFLPQFHLINFSVNPDSLTFFLSALFFSTAASLFVRKFTMQKYIFLIVLAGIGFFTDKSVFSLVLLLFLLPLFFMNRAFLGKYTFRLLLSAGMFILLLSWIFWFFPSPVVNTLSVIKSRFLHRMPEIGGFFVPDSFNRRFFSLLAESFFFKFGWMAYAAEGIVYLVFKTCLAFSFLGMVLYSGRAVRSIIKKIKGQLYQYKALKLMVFFSCAFILQLFLTWIVFGSRNILAQGRYLFPAIIPAAALFVAGIYSFFVTVHKESGKAVLCTLVLAEFLFLNYAVWNYIIPVFHLTQKTPLPGF